MSGCESDSDNDGAIATEEVEVKVEVMLGHTTLTRSYLVPPKLGSICGVVGWWSGGMVTL